MKRRGVVADPKYPRQRRIDTLRAVDPLEERGPNEWAIFGEDSVIDRRVQSEVVLSAGNARERNSRHASLRIGNQVVILTPRGQNSLAVALLRINDDENRHRRGVVSLRMPTTTDP